MPTGCCILSNWTPKNIPHSSLQDERAHCCTADSTKGFPSQSADGVILAGEASAEAAARVTGAARLANSSCNTFVARLFSSAT